jgi:hypothetical protein
MDVTCHALVVWSAHRNLPCVRLIYLCSHRSEAGNTIKHEKPHQKKWCSMLTRTVFDVSCGVYRTTDLRMSGCDDIRRDVASGIEIILSVRRKYNPSSPRPCELCRAGHRHVLVAFCQVSHVPCSCWRAMRSAGIVPGSYGIVRYFKCSLHLQYKISSKPYVSLQITPAGLARHRPWVRTILRCRT